MENNTLIIDNSGLLSKTTLVIQAIVTLIFWCSWGYLALPLISPLTNLLGIDITYHNHFDTPLFIGLLITMILVSVYVVGTMIIWSLYNLLLHRRGRNIQKSINQTLHCDLAGYFGVKTNELSTWQQAKTLNIELSGTGSVQYVQASEMG